MDGIFSQLGHLFVQSFPTVIFIFLLLVILNKIFFAPLIRVLKQREDMTSGAQVRAREQTAAAETKTREYDAAFQLARQEVYRQREADRQATLKEREALLQKAREQSEGFIQTAQEGLKTEVEAAKVELGAAARSMAGEIADVVLGKGPSTTRPGGAQS